MINVSIDKQCDRYRVPRTEILNSIKNTLMGENVINIELNCVFCDDEFIHSINREYLNHDYPTDVISFVIDEEPLIGEIYVSLDTAKLQADEYKVSLTNELKRLAVHGTLHIIGYDDDTDEKREIMHNLENKYID